MKATLITNIQKFSVNDGPGFRTTVFLKGCLLRCRWCHNPETISSRQEVLWKQRLCVECGACYEVCPEQAILPVNSSENGVQKHGIKDRIDRSACNSCLECVESCPQNALVAAGQPMTVDQTLEEVEKDKTFYENSGGGLTISGGEPTLHHRFTLELMEKARYNGLHVCLDTSGYCDSDRFRRLTAGADIVLFDFKLMNSGEHQRFTGVGNEEILANLEWLVYSNIETWIRIPVVPGVNDSGDVHATMADYLISLSGDIDRVDLLPFHNWCENKYEWLGLSWDFADVNSIDPVELEQFAEYYRAKGIFTTIGGSGFEVN